jgi:hypothetical protein
VQAVTPHEQLVAIQSLARRLHEDLEAADGSAAPQRLPEWRNLARQLNAAARAGRNGGGA